ncbi:hypothetical protein [Clostridium polynesiense]|uniref:hypothetical protein n=1 Tax=Clostridium polynesiense TaxID=1325933 RepID=UPI00058F8AA3|nr:hypothetical protein [Clostridium polynesiense]
MKNVLIEIKLPKEYKENLFEYKPGLNNIPDWPLLKKGGWTFQEHLKLEKLIEIEYMKYVLQEAITNEDINSDDEMKQYKIMIKNAIEEYNNL